MTNFKPDTAIYRIDPAATFAVRNAPTAPPQGIPDDLKLKKQLRRNNQKLYELQRKLYAENRHALLLVFQAMDAAGKDSTIRTVMRGVNPAGCQVFSFKQPSAEELEHDFLWRSAIRLPERGRIGIFNRSYYEETLVVRVHPHYLDAQNLPEHIDLDSIWEQRFQAIRDHESHLHANGIKIIKFWLNVSKSEQKTRFLERIRDPRKNWKFSKSDIRERSYWDDYMRAYEDTLNKTSTRNSPWYAIPADHKPFARLCVAEIIVDALENLHSRYPAAAANEKAHFEEMEMLLMNEGRAGNPETP